MAFQHIEVHLWHQRRQLQDTEFAHRGSRPGCNALRFRSPEAFTSRRVGRNTERSIMLLASALHSESYAKRDTLASYATLNSTLFAKFRDPELLVDVLALLKCEPRHR